MENVFKSKFLVSFFSLVMVITMLMVPTIAFASTSAEESIVQPRWSYLYACDNSLQLAENISPGIMIYGGTEVYEGHAGVEIQLQKWNGYDWLNVSDCYWEAYSSTGFAYAFEDDVDVSAGVYRLSLIHTAYSSRGVPLEEFETYSNELTVRASN
ncbi:MAG: hypothetical protein IJX99_04550 [Clostridia bacterium]|nr:hypothetical protein [Clostridia bacterium]